MIARLPETVDVYVDIARFEAPVLMGALHGRMGRSENLFSFEYAPTWLRSRETFSFDPDLALVEGRQYPANSRGAFGILLDSMPDRWGRALMQKREMLRARQEERRARSLTEWDFLLGVHDETRLGALRFRDPASGQFFDTHAEFSAPPLASLRKLQAASLQFEAHQDVSADDERWLTQLFAPGSSLGGARPKASVRDEKGVLCLAKFPSRQDRRDVGAWELVAHRLARAAGINVPRARALRGPGSLYTTFLAERFDRTPTGRRIAFVSAMTLTQHSDGEPGASYLELVDLLQSRGSTTREDCAELFRRVVFNILIHNSDDHLRNHGFFVTERGITLSPAYDINPSNESQDLSLAINEVETACDVSIALQAHADYGLSKIEAGDIVAETVTAIASWRKVAGGLNIPKDDQELMAPAFESAL